MNYGCYTTKEITAFLPAKTTKHGKCYVKIDPFPYTLELFDYKFGESYLEGYLAILQHAKGSHFYMVETVNFGDTIITFPVSVRIPYASIQKVTYRELNITRTVICLFYLTVTGLFVAFKGWEEMPVDLSAY